MNSTLHKPPYGPGADWTEWPVGHALDEAYRRSGTCPACGREKDVGCVVCWGCFKYHKLVTPWKHAYGVSLID